MVNVLEGMYVATAFMLLMALVRLIGSRRSDGERRAVLAEKARRYFMVAMVLAVMSIVGYRMLGPN